MFIHFVFTEFQQVTESLLDALTRGLARRVFELHRGAMNKKLMSMKKQELTLKRLVSAFTCFSFFTVFLNMQSRIG